MSDAKIKPEALSPAVFVETAVPASKQADARVLLEIFERITGQKAQMWTGGIIGFGEYRTTYASGRDVHWMRSGFSPRKARHSLYLMGGYCDEGATAEREEMLCRLGKHSEGKSCLYINKLADIDLDVLEQLITADWAAMQRLYPD